MPADREFMWRAIELARRGRGNVSPNPMVGCVIVREGKVVGRGFHEQFGGAHAEVNALEDAKEKAWGSTMFVTLEPCCHAGPEKKTPPCVPRIVEARVARVVVAMEDPNPLVAGRGIAALQEAGLDVEVGLMGDDAAELNAPYLSLLERGWPYVTAKWAMTLDGKIATRKGDSKWISSDDARKFTHMERGCNDAIMVGIGTVLADNPSLTARGGVGRQPVRVLADPQLMIPETAELVKTAREVPVLLYTSATAPADKRRKLEAAGIETVTVKPDTQGHAPWQDILFDLGRRKLSSLLIEGGAGLLASAFEHKVIDRVMVFVAPLIVGGLNAKSAVGGTGVPLISQGIRLADARAQMIGPDTLVQGYVEYPADSSKPSQSGIWRGFKSLRRPTIVRSGPPAPKDGTVILDGEGPAS